MTEGFPRIPYKILSDLSNKMTRGVLDRAALETAAQKMGVSLPQFMESLAATQGEAGSAGVVTRDASTKLASRIYDAANAAYRSGKAASGAGEIASTAGTVARGSRILGFFGRIGSVGGFLSGTAATVAGVAATIVVLAPAAWYAGGVLGDMAGDEPTAQYGDAINHNGRQPASGRANGRRRRRRTIRSLATYQRG